MKNRKWNMLLGILIFFCAFWLAGDLKSQASQPNKIRVGYPIQSGFTERTEEGGYRGYTYDYLQEIAQYTNWEYEYITPEGDLDAQLTALLDMLKQGDIDILGAMTYSDSLADIYSYPEYNYGTGYTTLCVLSNNGKFTEFNYSTFQNIRVAVYNAAGRYHDGLNKFAEANGFNAEQLLCPTEEEQLRLLKEGKADAILTKDMEITGLEVRVIARFAPNPFYFAVTKDNREILWDLNRAMENINASNPYFVTDLYERYFAGNPHMVLSEAEQDFVDKTVTLKAGVLLGKAPLQYKGADGALKGISFGILDYLTETTGLKFEVLPFDTWPEYEKAVKNREVDIVLGINEDYEMARKGNYTLTLPYLHAPLFMAMNENVTTASDLSEKKLAIQEGYAYDRKQKELKIYPTMEECIAAVHEGRADYCYGNSYSVQYYMDNWSKSQINFYSMPEDWSQKYGIGILKPADPMLVSMINKSVKAIPEDLLNHLLFENAHNEGELTFAEFASRNPEQVVVWLLLFCLATVGAVFVSLEWNRQIHAARKSLENQRYEQLSALSNEFLYEYDIMQECFHLTEQTAAFLGCKKAFQLLAKEKEPGTVFWYMTDVDENSVEHECLLPDGTKRWLKFVSKRVRDAKGRPCYAVGKIIDIQKEREIRNQLETRAKRDNMTGVYNAATSRQLIRELIEMKQTGAMIIMDVDFFKQINDSMGHYTGDQVLCEIAGILVKCFRPDDMVGRLGGDEFVIFMKGVKEKDKVKERCETVLALVTDMTARLHGKEITMSIGAAMAREDDRYDKLYTRADQALYQVKNLGRNGIKVV